MAKRPEAYAGFFSTLPTLRAALRRGRYELRRLRVADEIPCDVAVGLFIRLGLNPLDPYAKIHSFRGRAATVRLTSRDVRLMTNDERVLTTETLYFLVAKQEAK